jgi:hypothetical protein
LIFIFLNWGQQVEILVFGKPLLERTVAASPVSTENSPKHADQPMSEQSLLTGPLEPDFERVPPS